MKRQRVLLGLVGVVLGLVLTLPQQGGCETTATEASSTMEPGSGTPLPGVIPSPPAKGDNEAAALLKDFQQLMKMPKRMDDCDSEGTKRSLNFLALTTDDVRNKTMKELEDVGVKGVDCSLRKTEMDKLRKFLANEGFTKQHPGPGTLMFINAQDETIKLNCGGKNARWSVKGSKDDKMFNEEGTSGSKLDHRSPTDSLYFRTYTCRSLDEEKNKKCTHVFYVITRPQPVIDYPLQFSQHEQNIDVGCKINPRLYEKDQETEIQPRPAPPYSFEWSIPNQLFDKDAPRGVGCKNGPDDSSSPDGTIYIQFEPKSGNAGDPVGLPEPKADSGVNVTLSGKKKVKTKSGEQIETVVQSSVSIKDGDDKHRGHYECIVIDGNGVPSIPSDGSVDTHRTRFSGRALLHVRNKIWLIIPAVLILLMLVGVLLVGLLCPIKMEDDDGNVIDGKERAVAPAAPAEPTPASEGGDVPPTDSATASPSSTNPQPLSK